jgi:hypothetical protein
MLLCAEADNIPENNAKLAATVPIPIILIQ